MEIYIGRELSNSQLKLTSNGKDTFVCPPNSVPSSVGVNHCLIDYDNNSIKIKNLDVNNYTFVNGQSIETKAIKVGDKIELGPDHFLLDWKAIFQVAPVDIRNLKKVWDDYENHKLDQTIADRRFNSLRSATGLITMAAIALSILTGRQNAWFIALYAFAIIISIGFTIKAYRDASNIPQKQKQLYDEFQKDYVCPHCNHFLGNLPYNILEQNDQCPYCKTKFIH